MPRDAVVERADFAFCCAEQIVGVLPRAHFAVAVRYPGDANFYVEARRMPKKNKMRQMLAAMDKGK